MRASHYASHYASRDRILPPAITGATMTDLIHPYPYTITVEVSFRDLDALGHVNNAVYLTYMETARIKYLVDLLDLKALGELPVILAEASCTYKSPAFFGERL